MLIGQNRFFTRVTAALLCAAMLLGTMVLPAFATGGEDATEQTSTLPVEDEELFNKLFMPGDAKEMGVLNYASSAGDEGVVVKTDGTIFQSVRQLTDGKRYIIASYRKNGTAVTLAAPKGSYAPNASESVTIHQYLDTMSYIDAAMAYDYNVWRFQDAGTGTGAGYLISECNDVDEGYEPGHYYLAVGTDELTVLLDSDITNDELSHSGMGFLSATWTYSDCLHLLEKNANDERIWMGFRIDNDNYANNCVLVASDSAWISGYQNAYVFEEVDNVAKATVSSKLSYLALNAESTDLQLILKWTNGKVEYEKVTPGMLSKDGQPLDLSKNATYENVTVTRGDVVICDDLTVVVGEGRPNTVISTDTGRYYYRLTNQLTEYNDALNNDFLIVSRNSVGGAIALKATGVDLPITIEKVAVTLDSNGVPCIAGGTSLDNGLKFRYGFSQATWGKWPGQYYGWVQSAGYPEAYLNTHAVVDGKWTMNTVDWVYANGEWGDVGTQGTSFWEIDPDTGNLRAWCIDPDCVTTDHPKGQYEYVVRYDNAFGSQYESHDSCDVYIYERVPVAFVTYSALGNKGTVQKGSGLDAVTGSRICLTYSDGSFEFIPVTVDMLFHADDTSVTAAELQEDGRIDGLVLKYSGFMLDDTYTLSVISEETESKPEYPDPGSVIVDKQLGKSDYVFSETGVTRVDVTTQGIPMNNNKLDILIVVDTSSSVGDNYVGPNTTRVQAIRESVDALIHALQKPHVDGTLPDVHVALSEFNDYTYFDTANLIDIESGTDLEKFRDASPNDYNGQLLDFTDVHDLNSVAHLIRPHSGTNYDVAFQNAYSILEARKAEYATIGEREQVVVFMTDGICFQYNYVSYRHGAADSKYWKGWLWGTLDEDGYLDCIPDKISSFYNSDGRHWMAEAIKGEPGMGKYRGQYFTIWNDADYSGAAFDPNVHLKTVDGLGATIYTIGFGLSVDGGENAAAGKQILSKMASDPAKHYDVETAEELHAAYRDIANLVHRAGTSAYVMDQMGDKFDLQMGTVVNSKGEKLAVPSITISAYDVYRPNEIGTVINGQEVTSDMVGTRKNSTPNTILETITFSEDGKKAYSDKVAPDANGNPVNILVDGVIRGVYFYYNANKTEKTVAINNVSVTIPAETIYWAVGEITEQQLELSYYVYLEDAMGENGGRDAGIYDTNNYADLTYTNYQGETIILNTESPDREWKDAKLSYAFYLVDEDGNIIVDDLTGATGDFADKIEITNPVTEDLNMNVDGSQDADVNFGELEVPDGYELYDPEAAYKVHVNSGWDDDPDDGLPYEGTPGGYWEIVGDTDTTYVTVSDSDYSNDKTCDEDDVDYSNTTVWFAVKYVVKAAPDVVVIDYGIPVNVNVTGNDQFPGTATIDKLCQSSFESIIANSKSGSILKTDPNAPAVVDKIEKDLYTAQLVTVDGKQMIQFALNPAASMVMNTHEVFAYRVPYTYTKMVDGVKTQEERYYFSTVTVIPATTIYYEDNFVDFKVYQFNKNDKDAVATLIDETNPIFENVKWVSTSEIADFVQQEDRPGFENGIRIDADNIYGHDSAYANMSTYSLNAAMKFTATEDANGLRTYGTAEFDFYGTGFDIISLSSKDTGLVFVQVYRLDNNGNIVDANGTRYDPTDKDMKLTDFVAKSKVVNTYYGYKFEDNKWIPDTSIQGDNSLYQVPVLKVDKLTYGKYRAVITVSYADAFDYNLEAEYPRSYDFYLDAIRIYDPANDGEGNTTIQGAYTDDHEGWPEYFELRNMIIKRGDLDYTGEVTIPGVVYIDNTNAENKAEYQISNYQNYGPNNELYLAPGQAIAFQLNLTDEKLDRIHLAMKSVGGTANVEYYNLLSDGTTQEDKKAFAVATATDLYYDITELNGDIVVIKNTSGSILSITNVKVTYTGEHQDGLNKGFCTVNSKMVTKVLNKLNNITEEEVLPENEAQIKLEALSLSLESEVLVNVYYSLDHITADVDHMGLLTWDTMPADAAANIEHAQTVINGVKAGDGCYMVATDGIPAKELGDDIYLCVYVDNGDGTYTYSDVIAYSPKTYAMNRLAKSSDDNMKALCVALMNYGAEAQKYFGYKTNALMNAEITEEQQALVAAYNSNMLRSAGAVDEGKIGTFNKTANVGTIAVSMSLDGEFALNYYLAPNADNNVDGEVTFYYWTAEDYKAADVLTVDNVSGSSKMQPVVNAKSDSITYCASIGGITAAEMEDIIYAAAVYLSGDNTYCTGVIAYSVATYCNNKAENENSAMCALTKATAVYGYYIGQYFTKEG